MPPLQAKIATYYHVPSPTVYARDPALAPAAQDVLAIIQIGSGFGSCSGTWSMVPSTQLRSLQAIAVRIVQVLGL